MREIWHIVFAYLMLAFAFGALFAGPKWREKPFSSEAFLALPKPFAMALVTLGPAFLVHELSHRVTAIRRGVSARFVSSPVGLATTVILATVAGVLFAIPGGVIVEDALDVVSSGRVALAGPLSNLAMLPLYLSLRGVLGEVSRYGLIVNSALAFFNMLPLEPLDGAKVMKWNKAVWLIAFITSMVIYTSIVRELL